MGERRVGEQQPTARRDAIGLVAKPFGENLREILDRHCAEQFGVYGRHPVGAVRTDDGQICHADPSQRILLDQAHALDAAFIAGKAGAHFFQETVVDLVNDFQLAREQHFEPCHRPFLQRFEAIVCGSYRPASAA